MLRVRGEVIPACNGRVSLVAHHGDDTKSTGEVQITRSGKPIERIELRPEPVPLSGEIRERVRGAELFLFGPGSLYTSVIPNLLIDGLMAEVNGTGKPRVYVGNIMTQPGETDGYRLSDHIRALRRHVGDDFPDVVIAHNGDVPESVQRKYEEEGAIPVQQDLSEHAEFRGIRVIQRNFFASGEFVQASSARHDSDLLARVIYEEFLSPSARSARHVARGARVPG